MSIGRPILEATNLLPAAAVTLLNSCGGLRSKDSDVALAHEELLSLVRGADAVLTLLHDPVDDGFFEAAGPSFAESANVAEASTLSTWMPPLATALRSRTRRASSMTRQPT